MAWGIIMTGITLLGIVVLFVTCLTMEEESIQVTTLQPEETVAETTEEKKAA